MVFCEGLLDVRDYFRANNPWLLAEQNAALIRGRVAVRIGVGEQDGLLERNRKYHELLGRLKIGHEFFTVPGVAHENAKFYEVLGTSAFDFYRKILGAS